MKRFAIIAFLLALGLLPHHLAAQSKDRTGVDLLEECQLAVSGDASTADKSMKATFCVGYLLGVLDTYTVWSIADSKTNVASSAVPCVPNGVTVLEVSKVVVKYLNAHPDTIHESYKLLVWKALLGAYPPQSHCVL